MRVRSTTWSKFVGRFSDQGFCLVSPLGHNTNRRAVLVLLCSDGFHSHAVVWDPDTQRVLDPEHSKSYKLTKKLLKRVCVIMQEKR